MKKRVLVTLLLSGQVLLCIPVYADQVASAQPNEPGANSVSLPTQILKTGINLNGISVSPNTLQLAEQIGVADLFTHLKTLQARVESNKSISLESLAARQELTETKSNISQLIQKANLEVDFVQAEISAEENLYGEILSTYTNNRDKAIARSNALSFISNGALWAIGEAYDIPTYKYPRLSIPSGTISILAGVIPSAASMYTFKQLGGKKSDSEVEPNMLAKLFNYPVSYDIEYPKSVWAFLNAVPANQPKGKSRREQLVDRWIADSNISSFTDRTSKEQLDKITASVSVKKGLSIATLSTRQVLLQQLGSEVLKMKRMLLELCMVLQGDKEFSASLPQREETPISTKPFATD
jgi:hypothetical protein